MQDGLSTKLKPRLDLRVIDGQLNGVARRSYTLADFEVSEMMGSGKYGKVYKARDRVGNRVVALKVSFSLVMMNLTPGCS